MCSEADPTEQALRDSQAAFTTTMQSAFSKTFASNQAILGSLTNDLTKVIANPQGYTPAEMTALRTGATDTVAQATKNATIAAGNYAASHGGADLGSGVTAQIEGGIQTSGMQQTAQEQNQITIANAERQQQNYWNAISGLTQVGAAYNPTGYANAETNSANATTNASNAVTQEQQAGWQNAFGVVSGVAGLASAAAGVAGGFGGGAPTSAPTSTGPYGSGAVG